MAVLVAPLVGGAVYASAGYYAVFYVSFRLITIDILMRVALIEKKDARKWIDDIRIDHDQPQTNVEKQSVEQGTDEEVKSAITVPSTLGLVESLTAERTQSESNESAYAPIFSLMKSPCILTALFRCLVQSTLFSTFDTVLPLYVHALFGWGSLGSGLIFLALLIPSFASPIVGWVNDRLGPKWISCIGFLLCALALILLREVTHHSIGQVVLLCALLAIVGFGVNFIAIPLAAEISYTIEAHEEKRPRIYGSKGAYAQGYALLNTRFAAGGLVGPIWSGYIVIKLGWGTLG